MSHIRIRQICLVAQDLDRIQRLCESVFGVEVCYRDPGVGKYGLHNFLIPFGDQFLETLVFRVLLGVPFHVGDLPPAAGFDGQATSSGQATGSAKCRAIAGSRSPSPSTGKL